MNLFTKNLELTESIENNIFDTLDFIDEFSPNKESSLRLIKNHDEFEFKLFFYVEDKQCIVKIKDIDLKRGIKKIRYKSYKKIMSIINKPVMKETIRKMPITVDDNPIFESNVSYIKTESLDKPMTEEDAKDIMIEKKLNDIIFTKIDDNESISFIHIDKDKFKIYLTDIELY